MITIALCSHSRYLCGAERMLLNLALVLEKTNAVRAVLLTPGEGELACEARRRGIPCHLVTQPLWHLLQHQDMRAYGANVASCIAELERTFVDLNVDVALVNTLTNIPAMLAAVSLNIPSLLWVHGVIDSLLLPARSSDFAAPHDELLLHAATRVVALSNYTSAFCAQIMGRKHLDIIPNWTPLDPAFAVSPEKYRSRHIACLNTFDRHKGHGLLLEAAALLKKRNVAFVMEFYGAGPTCAEIEDRATELGLRESVFFQGRTNDVQAVYDRALAVVNPAQAEPFGMTLIEAMARKTPVVATRSGGPEEIVVDGQTGFLVGGADAAALADRLQSLLDSPELACRLGDAGFQRVRAHYSEDVARASFLPLIEETVAEFRGYEPAIKAAASAHRFWSQVVASQPTAAPPALFSAHTTARLARGGMRRVRALGRLLAAHAASPRAVAGSTPSQVQNLLAGPIGAVDSTGPHESQASFRPLGRNGRFLLVPTDDNWAGLDVLVRCRVLPAAGRLRLYLRAASGQVVREAVSAMDKPTEPCWLGFRFDPIANAAGTRFHAEIVAEGLPRSTELATCGHSAQRPGSQAAKRRFARVWQRRALYCKTWYT